MNNENWVSTENVSAWRKQALKCSYERKKLEEKLKKQGKKRVLIPDDNNPGCFIEKWI